MQRTTKGRAPQSGQCWENLRLGVMSDDGRLLAVTSATLRAQGSGRTCRTDPAECEVLQRGRAATYTLFQHGTWRVVSNGRCVPQGMDGDNTLALDRLDLEPGDALRVGSATLRPENNYVT